jgi:hypothetical protein
MVVSSFHGWSQGMRKEEAEVDVRHAATVALQNALTFAHNNFSNDNERNYVMQIICEGTLAGGWLAITTNTQFVASLLQPVDRADAMLSAWSSPLTLVAVLYGWMCRQRAHPAVVLGVPGLHRVRVLRQAAGLHAGGLGWLLMWTPHQ